MQILKRIFTEPTNHLATQFFRYLLVGGAAFGVDFLTLYGLILLPFFQKYYNLAVVIAFIFGLATNYLLSIRWVFNKRKIENKPAEFLYFTVIGIIGLLINIAIINLFMVYIFVQIVHIPEFVLKILHMQEKPAQIMLSKVVSTVFVYVWNFTARKIFLF